MNKRISIPLTILLLLCACSPSTAETQVQEVPTNPPSESTEVPASTQGPTSTDTPVPTETPVPTSTDTPEPTSTPTITPTFSPDTLVFEPGQPVRIGYLLWEDHPLGIDSLRGIQIAIEDFGGEILGHPIELTGYNTECNELAGQRGAQNLIVYEEAVVGIIGTTCSVSALRAANIVSDGGRVLISPSTTLAELTAPDSRAPGFFRTPPSDFYEVNAAAQYAYDELGVRRLATVYVGSRAYQRLQSLVLCDTFSELGGECVLERTMEEGSTYMDPIINSLVEAAPEAVYFMNFDFGAGAAFLNAVRETPELQEIPIFVWQAYNSPGFLEAARDQAIGVYVSVTSYEFDQNTNAYLAFLESYRNNFGEEPLTIFHAYAYDAATLLLKALEQVVVLGENESLMVDPMAVREALYAVPGFAGLSGWIECDPNGDCDATKEGKIYQFIDGDPSLFNPGPQDSLSSNPIQLWP